MGGKTFTAPADGRPGLHVPRMSTELYHALQQKYRHILTGLYEHVEYPWPAPGKTSHGDLDFLVCGPRDGLELTKDRVAAAFSAHTTAKGGPGVWSFAVAIPEELREDELVGQEQAYVQVDVDEGHDVASLKWLVFKMCYGDAWQILGVVLRPLGLVGDQTGLCLSIKEIEDALGPRKMRRVFLTEDVNETLDFLLLDRDKFYQGFATEQDLFKWIIATPLFSKWAFTKRDDAGQDEDAPVQTQNDRRAYRKRPMFFRFRNEFLPTVDLDDSIITHDIILQRAFERYGVQQEYQQRLLEFRKHQFAPLLLRRLADHCTAESRNATFIVKAMKRWVRMDGTGGPVLLTPDEAKGKRDSSDTWGETGLDQDAFFAWLVENLDAAVELEAERQSLSRETRLALLKAV